MRRAFSNCARGSSPTTRTAMRSPMPSTSHQAFAVTLASTTAPLRRSKKYWSSSICAPSYGCTDATAGPPVLKANSVGPVSASLIGFQSARAFKVQRVPGGTASRKSYSQTRSLAQRLVPAGTAPWQLSVNGSGSRRSPNGTTASENLTVIWRTCATSPCGLTLVMVAAGAAAFANRLIANRVRRRWRRMVQLSRRVDAAV